MLREELVGHKHELEHSPASHSPYESSSMPVFCESEVLVQLKSVLIELLQTKAVNRLNHQLIIANTLKQKYSS